MRKKRENRKKDKAKRRANQKRFVSWMLSEFAFFHQARGYSALLSLAREAEKPNDLSLESYHEKLRDSYRALLFASLLYKDTCISFSNAVEKLETLLKKLESAGSIPELAQLLQSPTEALRRAQRVLPPAYMMHSDHPTIRGIVFEVAKLAQVPPRYSIEEIPPNISGTFIGIFLSVNELEEDDYSANTPDMSPGEEIAHVIALRSARIEVIAKEQGADADIGRKTARWLDQMESANS